MQFEHDYTFVVKEYDNFHYINGRVIQERAVGIGIKEEETNRLYPSPLTHYIRTYYRGASKSLSSQRNAAYELVKFLNYISKQVKNERTEFVTLKEEGLFGLRLIHGSQYISYLSLKARSEELSSDYVYRIESYLIKFYQWLSTNQIIQEKINIEKDSPFNNLELGTIYPGRDERVSDKLVDFGENRYELVQKFIRIAQDIAPDIALGICFQVFGGLRTGEIVNLTKEAIESPYYWDDTNVGESKFILKVRERHSELFINKINRQHEGVKRPRNQALLTNPLLSQVYKEHKQHLKRLNNQKNIKNQNALFIAKRTGEPMSGKTYTELFNKVKKGFLKSISDEGRMDDYLFLTDKKWSTHIGRGIFTNFLLQVGATIPEVAIARGDKNIGSVMSYVEEKNALHITKEAIDNIRIAAEIQNADINKKNIDNFNLREVKK
ncbi:MULTISPECIES: tyrosine-type recombinase/integrase [Bacillus cereus group]|uniref:tyrosine-type recombinase/integrase n=1 Tax=Bacillus cereus group TaxID=86661 RepID=UPI0009956A5D|nr:tyrosine-type recombinase/integrase [Bacillus cereus]